MRRTLRLALAAAVAAVLTLGNVPSEAAKVSTLTLISKGSAQGILHLAGRIHYDPTAPLDATSAGNYLGYLISDLHGRPVLGRLEARASAVDSWHETELWSPENGSVSPGTYLVTVISDARGVVRIPLASGTSASLTVRNRATAIIKIVEPTTPDLGLAGTPAAAMQVPVPAGRFQLAAITQFIKSSHSAAMVTEACFSASGSCAQPESGSSTRGVDLNPGGVLYNEEASTGSVMAPFTISSGTSALFDGLTSGLSGAQAGLVVLLK